MDKQVEEKLEQFESATRTDFPWVTAFISACGVVLSLLHIWFNTFAAEELS